MSVSLGPSVHKASAGRVVRRRQLVRLAVLDGWWAHVLARADVMSEGAVVAESAGATYYGTVSIRCTLDPLPEAIAALSANELAGLLLADPHARLRLVRLVHREVASRAPAPLGVVGVQLELAQAVVAGSPDGDGAATEGPVCIEVRADVQVTAAPAAARRRVPRGGARPRS